MGLPVCFESSRSTETPPAQTLFYAARHAIWYAFRESSHDDAIVLCRSLRSYRGLALAPAFLEGCKATGVGDPCTPEQEYDVTFNGFDEQEVNVESKSFQCQTRLCLVNHFRGRVSCPYGQDAAGNAPTGASACATPGSGGKELITGNPSDTKKGETVDAQCTDRTADNAVYCSCRCADVNGQTPSSEGNFCKCPDGFACTQLVTSIGAGDTGLTGAYCIKDKTAYDRTTACASTCDPTTAKCSGG